MRQIYSPYLLPYYFPFEKEVKSLGVILDSKLSWNSHVTTIERKVNRVLYTLRFMRHCTTETLHTRLIQALINPLLDYCNVAYLDANNILKAKLQRLSNSGLRYIFGVRRNSHICAFRKKLGWLRFDIPRLYFELISIYKILRIKQKLCCKMKDCGPQSFKFHGAIL